MKITRAVLIGALLASATWLYWERNSPVMGAEHFYRNVRLVGAHPAKLAYPDTVITATVREQTDFVLRCRTEYCGIWFVAYGNEPAALPILPGSWMTGGAKLSGFSVLVFAGKLERVKYREVLALVRTSRVNPSRISRIVRDPAVAQALEMYHLGIPVRLRARPIAYSVQESGGSLSIVIFSSLQEVQPLF